MLRKLATIQKVENVMDIADADLLEVVQILGWKCVVKKGEFAKGDMGVYFEVDSFLPVSERFEFLRKNCYRNNEHMGEGFKIRTMKLRGNLSQGLFIPLEEVPEVQGLAVGTDVTALLGVRKWDMPESVGDMGVTIGRKPFGIPTTDELRVQSSEVLLERMQGKSYYIATKLDGTSCTVYHKDGKVGVCGRNEEYKEDPETSAMWKYVKENRIDEKLKVYGKDIVLQGEFCGPGIQKNRLKLKEPKLFMYNMLDMNSMERQGFSEFLKTTEILGVETVMVEETGDSFSYTLDEILEKAKGKYPSGENKEGIVVRSKEPELVGEAGCLLSFKAINNDFLLKEK